MLGTEGSDGRWVQGHVSVLEDNETKILKAMSSYMNACMKDSKAQVREESTICPLSCALYSSDGRS